MDISRFELACERLFDLSNLQLSHSYHYNSIACCIVDAVYSIGVRYQSTENTVASFCKYAGIERYRKVGGSYDTYTASQLMQTIRAVGATNSADVIFHNRQRTSSRNGILKSEAVLRFAEILSKCGIDTFADFQRGGVPEKFEDEIKRIPGQKSGLALHYFYMLAGNDDFCKPDRHVLRFLSHYSGIPVDVALAQKVLEQAVREMKANYPDLTVRSLDYAIWNYAKDRKQLPDISGIKQYNKLVRDRIPEIIEKSGNEKIELYEDQPIRTAWNEAEEEWYFSIVDVVGVLTEQTSYDGARDYWKVLKKRLKDEGSQLVTECNQLKLRSPKDGKRYLTDVATTEQLLRIIQSIPSKKAEPFKMWLAQVGRELLEETGKE